jgi:RNA polymerase sigma factor (sigma-70 family)
VADRAAFEGFYRSNLARVVRACALVLLDRQGAEDVAAEAFARVWSRWGQIESEDHAGGFVFKTAMRLCARRGRLTRRERLVGSPERRVPDEIGRALDRRDVMVALAGLPIRQRQALVLRDWAGFETQEIAGMLGIQESTIRVHLARGRQSLRESLSVQEREG